jgi:TonB family protein
MQLNADGSVASAELANAASSRFFADLALKAARQWRFAAGTQSAVVRFDFTQAGTNAYLP